MLKAGRISAKFDIIDLSRGRITITSAQLFALQARLYKSAPDKQPNFQFVLDSLASKDTETKSTLDLAIKSLVIRATAMSFMMRNTLPEPSFFPPAISTSTR